MKLAELINADRPTYDGLPSIFTDIEASSELIHDSRVTTYYPIYRYDIEATGPLVNGKYIRPRSVVTIEMSLTYTKYDATFKKSYQVITEHIDISELTGDQKTQILEQKSQLRKAGLM